MGTDLIMRFEHWERRLNAIVERYGRMPFEWGVRDCAMFVAECVWAVTQKDPAAAWRRTYADAAGARRLLAAHGGFAGLVEAGLAAIGAPSERIHPNFGQRGDVCLLADETGGAVAAALGICLGAEVAGKSPAGLERRPLASATIVWAIR